MIFGDVSNFPHWIGVLLGKIFTGNPWVFTIKYGSGFPVKIFPSSHSMISRKIIQKNYKSLVKKNIYENLGKLLSYFTNLTMCFRHLVMIPLSITSKQTMSPESDPVQPSTMVSKPPGHILMASTNSEATGWCPPVMWKLV